MTRSLSSGREPRSANSVGNQGNRSLLDNSGRGVPVDRDCLDAAGPHQEFLQNPYPSTKATSQRIERQPPRHCDRGQEPSRTVLVERRDYLRMRVFYSVHPARIDGAGRAFHHDCPDCQTVRMGERRPPDPTFEPSAFHG